MNVLKNAVLCCSLIVPALSFAQAPNNAPAGTTGLCKDGSYSSAASKRGACAGHQGVKDWYAADAATPAVPKASASAPAPTPAATPMAKTPSPATTVTSSKAPAAGGGPGQVWVNTSSKVYHCAGSKYYGTTKAGEYMTEAAAKAAGAHADHGKACTS